MGELSSVVPTATSRRTVIKAAAWSVPVMVTAVAVPMASATGAIRSDIVLSFGDITQGSTRDITAAVIAFIDEQVRALGPQPPVEPDLILPPEPARPPGAPWNNPSGWAAYAAAMAQWALDVAAANADYADKVAAYLQELARYSAWDLAVKAFVARMNEMALQSEGLFFASVTYPRTLVVTNAGPDTIPAGAAVIVQTLSDINLVNAYLPNVGGVQAIQTGGTATLSHVTPGAVAVGATIFTQPLEYNPVAVTLNITGSVTQSSVTAMLSPLDQDTDVADHGDVISSPVGIRLDVATGDVQAILAEWQQFIDQAIAFYNLISPLLPDIDWGDIIGGILPLP